jgi:hypothetical protein
MASRPPKSPKVSAADAKAEQACYIRSLAHHGQAVEGTGSLPPGATHELIVKPSGAKRVKRKRFSAI